MFENRFPLWRDVHHEKAWSIALTLTEVSRKKPLLDILWEDALIARPRFPSIHSVHARPLLFQIPLFSMFPVHGLMVHPCCIASEYTS